MHRGSCAILNPFPVSESADITIPVDAAEAARVRSVLAANDESSQTPAMRQYFTAKAQHPDCLMFCRIGDFYELFYEDAIVASRELQLTLTARDKAKQQPMCGVPYHSAAIYLQRLLRKGYKIALCEQMEDPKSVKDHRAPRSDARADAGHGAGCDAGCGRKPVAGECRCRGFGRGRVCGCGVD